MSPGRKEALSREKVRSCSVALLGRAKPRKTHHRRHLVILLKRQVFLCPPLLLPLFFFLIGFGLFLLRQSKNNGQTNPAGFQCPSLWKGKAQAQELGRGDRHSFWSEEQTMGERETEGPGGELGKAAAQRRSQGSHT